MANPSFADNYTTGRVPTAGYPSVYPNVNSAYGSNSGFLPDYVPALAPVGITLTQSTVVPRGLYQPGPPPHPCGPNFHQPGTPPSYPQGPGGNLPSKPTLPTNDFNRPTLLPANDFNRPTLLPANDFNRPTLLPANDFNRPTLLPANNFNLPTQMPANDFNRPTLLPANDFNRPTLLPANNFNLPTQIPANDFNRPTHPIPSVYPPGPTTLDSPHAATSYPLLNNEVHSGGSYPIQGTSTTKTAYTGRYVSSLQMPSAVPPVSSIPDSQQRHYTGTTYQR